MSAQTKRAGSWIVALLPLAMLASCTRSLSEAQMFQPRPGPALTAQLVEASAALPPARKQPVLIPGAEHSDVLTAPATISAYREFLQLTPD